MPACLQDLVQSLAPPAPHAPFITFTLGSSGPSELGLISEAEVPAGLQGGAAAGSASEQEADHFLTHARECVAQEAAGAAETAAGAAQGIQPSQGLGMFEEME